MRRSSAPSSGWKNVRMKASVPPSMKKVWGSATSAGPRDQSSPQKTATTAPANIKSAPVAKSFCARAFLFGPARLFTSDHGFDLADGEAAARAEAQVFGGLRLAALGTEHLLTSFARNCSGR